MTTGTNFRFIIILLVAAVLVAGCGFVPKDGEVETRPIKDDLGRVVTVPMRVERAVSLAPSITESIFAVGAGDRLVGVTTFCNYPGEAEKVAKVGDTVNPNMETIVALKPQVVFVSTASQIENFTWALEAQGIAVFVSNPKTLDDVFADLRRLGAMFGTEGAAAERLNLLQARMMDVDEAVRGKQRTRVFLQISKEPLFTVGAESFLTGIVARAGGVSVTADVPTGYPKLSKETALALDPDVIILSDSEDNRQPNEAFANSKAVRSGRVFRIGADIVSRPGPRLVDALEAIAVFLYGAPSLDSVDGGLSR